MSQDPPPTEPPPTLMPPPLPPGEVASPPSSAAGAPVPVQPYVPEYLLYSSAAVFPYDSARQRARVLLRLLWASLVIQLAMLWSVAGDLFELRDRLARGETEAAAAVMLGDDGPWSREDKVFLVVGVVQVMVWVAFLVLWVMWVHRTYRNLWPLGAEGLSTTPGWAVGYNFIPILNLFTPFRILQETWRASDPSHHGGTSWREVPGSRLILAFWIMYVASVLGILATAAAVAAYADDPAVLHAAAWIQAIVVASQAVIHWIEIEVVRSLTDLQDARANLRGAG